MYTVTVVYPTDPLGIVPGGTDTCIRDILRCAPPDIEMRLVGVTDDPVARPVGSWQDCEVGGATFKFYPLMSVADLKRQMRIPLSAQFTVRLLAKPGILKDSDVIQFNRIEPAFATLGVHAPKVLIIHQNMNVLNDKSSDIRWKYFPSLYFKIEDFILKRIREVFIVREDAVKEYQQRFPSKAENIRFLPTWMNPKLFYYLGDAEKRKQREQLLSELKLDEENKLMIFVGRFDHQKDPIYLLDSLAALLRKRSDWDMVLVGDGILRADVEARIEALGLGQRVHLLGARSQDEVASFLRASDLLLLSSAYEGMPRCVVEALGCGVPVVTTKAGEVNLLIDQGKNGYIVEPKDPELFCQHVDQALGQLKQLQGEPCLRAVEQYGADVVLAGLYDTYRRYAAGGT
jgi:glycosyltransferase involved in cell wall biosynthesis